MEVTVIGNCYSTACQNYNPWQEPGPSPKYVVLPIQVLLMNQQADSPYPRIPATHTNLNDFLAFSLYLTYPSYY